jgi:hypothetical protein
MNKTMNTMMSLGSAIAASRAGRAVSALEGDDLLGWIGLSRRRSYFWENLALVGVGAVVGATGALLFAPASGRDTRRRIKTEVSRLGDEASQKIDEVTQKAKQNLLAPAEERAAFRPSMATAERNS